MKNKELTITVPTTISFYRIACLLVGAFEGGSNYWYVIDEFIKPKPLDYQMDEDSVCKYTDYPLSTGGALIISDCEGDYKGMRLDLDSIKKGLEVMANMKANWHWTNFLQEQDDAETADVFLQCCLFGEVIFG